MKNVDFIIVGQGIAGSCLASTLIEKGKSVVIFDNPNHNKASHVAAGMMNPVVFRRFTTSWKAIEALPFSKEFYRHHETKFGKKMLHEKSMLKVLANEQEIDFWKDCAKKPDMVPFLNPEPMVLSEEFNGVTVGEVNQTAHLDVPLWLNALKDDWKTKNIYFEEDFDYAELNQSGDLLKYKEIKAEKIVFCEGIKAGENPLFPKLEFKPAKGELLEISAEASTLTKILKKGIFILPKSDNKFLVGATYEWKDLEPIPTEKGEKELRQKLENVFTAPYSINKKLAGIRPTVPDRRALIGFHPSDKRLSVFNGLGTKGVLLGPYLAHYFTDKLIQNDYDLDPEVDVSRFW
ncbi:MAG: glycine oxidase [Sphingobacteriales bacterium]